MDNNLMNLLILRR